MTPRARTGSIEPLGEDALLLRCGDALDLATNARVHACAAALQAARPGWVRDIVPAFATLAVFVDLAAMPGGVDPFAATEAWVRATCGGCLRGDGAGGGATRLAALAAPAGAPHEVPVAFGGPGGPDLAAVAAAAGLSVADAITRFCAPLYQVAMLGFAPGFPYLLGLDPALAMPRLETPRTHVPAGSVAIGGAQAGIYPREGPGGWRLLGRTPLALFDPGRASPALLAPGDHVRFVPAP